MENQLDRIYATLAQVHEGVGAGLHHATQGAHEIATSWEAMDRTAAGATNDASGLMDARVNLQDAYTTTREVMEILPQLGAALNRYAATLGLGPFEELSVSPAADLEPRRVDTPSLPSSTPGIVQSSTYTVERAEEPAPTLAAASSSNYDIIAVLGSAFNFARKRFPKHVYKSLDNAGAMYNQGKSVDGIVLCGRGAIKDIEKGRVTAESEARLMQDYLTSKGIDRDAITLEEASVSTPESFLFFKRLAEINDWRRVYLPVAAGRVNRVALLAAKICYEQCSFDIRSVPCNTSFPDEPKLFGDQVCTLQEMDWGDEQYIIDKETGLCKWKTMSDAHHACNYYVPGNQIKPNHNYHPAALMREFGTPPADAVTILQ